MSDATPSTHAQIEIGKSESAPAPSPKPTLSAAKPKEPKSQAADPPERITQAGAIQIENAEQLDRVPLFYENGRWFAGDGMGSYAKITDSQAKSFVAEFGFNKNAKDGNGNTLSDRALLWMTQKHRVAFAGPLAGYRAGVHESGGIRFLVTESPGLINPQVGNCSTIRTLIESMLFEENQKHDQRIYFYLWLSESYKAYYRRVTANETDKFRHCPALAIFGPRGCGKSALIDLILTPLFGGKKSDPMNYLRDQKFNKDLFPASLLVLDDKGASANLAERKQRGEAIKDLIWKADQRMEGKGVDALVLRPFWRLIIAGNDDDSGLQVCPALSPSLEDKLLIFRARPAEGLPTTNEENDAWAAKIRDELPEFAEWLLLKWESPDGLQLDPRTRVANFKHPQIVSALRDLQPEMRLLELIGALESTHSDPLRWEGTATDFEKQMRAKDENRLLDRIFTNITSAGRMLTELSRIAPDRIVKTDRDGRSHYRIYPGVEKG